MNREMMELLDKIESVKFDIELNVTSNFTIYKESIIESEYFGQMKEMLNDSNTNEFVEYVFNRISLEIDRRYLNPLDTAIAFYILLLDNFDSVIAQRISTYLISLSKNCDWAYKMASYVLVDKTASYDSSSNFCQIYFDDVYAITSNNIYETKNMVMRTLPFDWMYVPSNTNSSESDIEEITLSQGTNQINTAVSDSGNLELAA